MVHFAFRAATVALLASALAVPALSAPADTVRARVAGYKELGQTFKGLNDGLRGTPDISALRQATARIQASARQQYGWFPRGSGAVPGVKTAAKPEIWTRGAEFRAAQDRFSAQAAVLQQAATSGNLAAVRSEARKLGGTCKGCHDTFRAE